VLYGEKQNGLKTYKKCSYPLSAAGEERVDQRSVVGVSRRKVHAWVVMSAGVDSPCHRCARHPSLPQAGKRDGECLEY